MFILKITCILKDTTYQNEINPVTGVNGKFFWAGIFYGEFSEDLKNHFLSKFFGGHRGKIGIFMVFWAIFANFGTKHVQNSTWEPRRLNLKIRWEIENPWFSLVFHQKYIFLVSLDIGIRNFSKNLSFSVFSWPIHVHLAPFTADFR